MSSIDPGAGVTPVAPPATPASGVPAGSPPVDRVGVPSTPSPDSVGLRQLREQYETTKSKLEPWEKLGAKPEDVTRSHQTYTKMSTEAVDLGRQLGLNAETVQSYFQDDPVGTLLQLRQAIQQYTPQDKPLTRAEAERIAEAKLKEGLKPFEMEREQRLDTEAESRFDGEFNRQFETSFPNGLPESNKQALQGLAWQLLIDNKDAYNAVRGKGDISSVEKAFSQAKETFLKIISDYGEHEKARIGGQPRTPPGQQQKPAKDPTLDEIINGLGRPESEFSMERAFRR